jgi:NAD(P)-dependent dehydrogenase (short-subunit alcohol dehydrogenase family)
VAPSGNADQPLAGKHALVTGASRGIGAAISRAFAEAGAAVTVTARTAEPGPGRAEGSLAEVVQRIHAAGGEAGAVVANLAVPDDRRRLIDVATEARGLIAVLVNNAAVTWFEPVERFGDRHWELMIEVQVRAPFDLAGQVVPGMRASGGGWILNISSGAARHPAPDGSMMGGTVYGMCKAALERFSTGLASELHADGIAVNALSPSKVVPTPGTIHHGLVGRPGQEVEPPERFAAAALALCTGDPAVVTGQVTYTDEVLGPSAA